MTETEKDAYSSLGRAPKVSIIIPAYNTAAYIAETLDSVFSQTFTDFEAIVINDGSPDTDELERVLTPYRDRIVYLKQENRGLAGARNTGVRRARGEYLAFLDSDDCWLPDYLASQLKIFEETPSLDMVYCDAWYFGNPIYDGMTYMQTCPSKGPVTLESLIKEDCQVIVSCTVIRRQVAIGAGLFDEALRRCEDYDLWLRVAYRGGKIAYQRTVLGRYRSRPNSLSRDFAKMSETLVRVYKKADKAMELDAKTRSMLLVQLAQAQAHFDLQRGRNFIAGKDFEQAKDALTKANTFFRSAKLKLVILGLNIAPSLTRLGVITWVKLVQES